MSKALPVNLRIAWSRQNRPDILIRRRAWFDGQIGLDPERLVFIDETGASTRMARRPWPP